VRACESIAALLRRPPNAARGVARTRRRPRYACVLAPCERRPGAGSRRPAIDSQALRIARRLIPALALLAALAAAPGASAWSVSPRASQADFEAFHSRFASSVYAYPRHGAAPLGLIGFDVWVELAADEGFADEPFFDGAVDGGLTGDLLLFGRVGARKGLPGGIDLGLSYGQALEGDLELVTAEIGWAIVDGGLVTPTLGLRLTGTRTVGSDAFELDQYGAELILSKGFAVLTPYVGGGVVYSEGRLDRLFDGGSEGGQEIPPTFETDDTRFVAYAGLTLNLLLPKITVEVARGEALTGAVRVAFGF
jgi:opacity protein-like surface antigen